MFDHMVVTELQRLSDILQTRFVTLQLVVDHRYQIVDETVLLVRDQTVSQQFLRGQQNLFVVVLDTLARCFHTRPSLLLQLAVYVDIAQRLHHAEVVQN
jgi:hypothetical protein